jgi:hypothetical protein
VHQIVRDVLQKNLMERNEGRAKEDLEGLLHSLMALLCGTLHPALTGWKDLTEKKSKPLHLLKSSKDWLRASMKTLGKRSQSGEFEA